MLIKPLDFRLFKLNLFRFLFCLLVHVFLLLLSYLLGLLFLVLVLLRVEKSIREEQLLGVYFVRGPDFLSVEGLGPEAQLRELVLESDQLIEEVGSDLQVGASKVHEL
jgi:hypothetical protein